MSSIDWLVLVLTLVGIIAYGTWKSRNNQNIESYLLANRSMVWYHVWLSVMATQASAVTFLAAPGLAYAKGMGFVQFYFGLPLAMVVVCISFVPIFHRLKVYTAYEFLEQRFDLKTRLLISTLFLLQRGFSTGISIYAPSLVLSVMFGIDLSLPTCFIGGVVIVYTVYGGTKAVSYTQTLQMAIIFGGMLLAGVMAVHLMPKYIGFFDTIKIATISGKTQAINMHFDWKDQYNIWSGLIGGFFLQLSYFGTDQSQVGRYLTAKSVAESRWGLLMNGLVKIPMQFLILLLGVMVFSFYQFNASPIIFNQKTLETARNTTHSAEFKAIEHQYNLLLVKKQQMAHNLSQQLNNPSSDVYTAASSDFTKTLHQADSIRARGIAWVSSHIPAADVNDTNYIFLHFVRQTFPTGLVGLLIAIIFLAAMGSLASSLNSLGSASVIDFYKRLLQPQASENHYLQASRLLTVFWGLFCIACAFFASKVGNLIEAVNIVGSLFYGIILGVFVVAFYLKKIGGDSIFWSAIVSEIIIVITWKLDIMAFLWLNVVGCILVAVLAYLFEQIFMPNNPLNKK